MLLVNSGSEANDLAWRMATAVTGRRGGLCTAFAYHGITEAIAALSPEGWFDAPAPDHVETWEPRTSTATAFDAALRAERGHAPAAAILDGARSPATASPTSTPAYVQELVRLTHEAGGLWIADEVQAGHGRTGEALWCVRALRRRPGLRHARQADGQRPPRRRGHHPQRHRRPARRPHDAVQHVRRQPRQRRRRARRARRDRGRARARPRAAHRARRSAPRCARSATRIGDVRGVGLAWGVELADRRRARARCATGCASSACSSAPPARTATCSRSARRSRSTRRHVPTLMSALESSL